MSRSQEDEITRVTKEIDTLNKEINFLVAHGEMIVNCPYELIISGQIRIVIESAEDIPGATAWLNKLNGYERGQEIIFFTSKATIAWEDKNGSDVELWLKTSVEDFPERLMPDNCCWKKTTSNDYAFVCKQEEH